MNFSLFSCFHDLIHLNKVQVKYPINPLHLGLFYFFHDDTFPIAAFFFISRKKIIQAKCPMSDHLENAFYPHANKLDVNSLPD